MCRQREGGKLEQLDLGFWQGITTAEKQESDSFYMSVTMVVGQGIQAGQRRKWKQKMAEE